MPKASPFATLIQGGDFFNFALPNDSLSDPAALVKAMESIFGMLLLVKIVFLFFFFINLKR